MSLQCGKLCSIILSEFFGDNVEKVGRDLYRACPKPLKLIASSTGLDANEVRKSLCALIKYGLVTFFPGKVASIPEYKFHPEKVITLIRYPRYCAVAKKLHGNNVEYILEELFRQGTGSMSKIILSSYKKIAKKLADPEVEEKKDIKIESLKDAFELLVNKHYLKRCSTVVEKSFIPEFVNEPEKQYQLVKVDLKEILKAVTDDSVTLNDNVIWELNVDRFHQDMRDDLLVTAMGRRFAPRGGEVMQMVLDQMYLCSDPWASISNPIFLSDLKDRCKKGDIHEETVKYLDEILAVMAGEADGFLVRADSSSIAYNVHLKRSVEELTWCLLANTVDSKYGPNAARIFRLIREQKFIEQEEIQKRAMLPDKEAKFLTYSMLQAGWIQQHELKKGLQKSSPSKTFFLFCIDIDQVVRMFMEVCFKSLYNSITRRDHEKTENRYLIEKRQRLNAIMVHMKKEGATKEQIAEIQEMITPPEVVLLETVRKRMNKLICAELQVDETLFLLQLYLKVQSNS